MSVDESVAEVWTPHIYLLQTLQCPFLGVQKIKVSAKSIAAVYGVYGIREGLRPGGGAEPEEVVTSLYVEQAHLANIRSTSGLPGWIHLVYTLRVSVRGGASTLVKPLSGFEHQKQNAKCEL